MSKKEKNRQLFSVVLILIALIIFFSSNVEIKNSQFDSTIVKPEIKMSVSVEKTPKSKCLEKREETFSIDDFWRSKIKINWEKFDQIKELESAPIKEVEVFSSAYYRPLRKQKKFFLGSYRREIRLNGKGYVTSSRVRPKIGTIAADTNIFPMGTILKIPGYGFGIVQDTGEKIQGYRIDLFMGEGQEALDRTINWGKKTIPVKVLGKFSLG